MQIFGHTGMKLSGNSAQWADYPGESFRFLVKVSTYSTLLRVVGLDGQFIPTNPSNLTY